MNTHVAICIVAFQNAEDIRRCLRSVEQSSHTAFEVIICENGGPIAFEQLKASLPEKLRGGQPVEVILAERNLGFAGGVNICISATPDADAWWILNPDTQPDPTALELKVERLGRGDCDAVGGTVYLPDGRVQSFGGRWRGWMARAESIGHGSPTSAKPDPCRIEKEQNYLNGASMLVSRRFLEVAGRMREEYFLYCEEVEWCLRAVRRGLRLGYAEGAMVLHYPGSTTGSYEQIRKRPRTPIYLNERNKMLTTRDVYPLLLPVAAISSLALIFLRFGRRAAWRQVGYGLAGWGAGLANARGVPPFLQRP